MQKILNIIVCMLLFVSCSQIDMLEREQLDEQDNSWHTAKLSLNCAKQGFDSNSTSTRATSTTTWQDGDKIYLRFSNDATTTQGNAVYNAPENAWYISYYGALTRDKEMSVEVYYFENPESVTEDEVKLSPSSAVYHDAEAKYIYPSGGDLTVTTNLSPTTSRVRFKGEPGVQINVNGLQTPSVYSINSNCSFSHESVTLRVLDNGYTDFVYSKIAGDRILTIENGDYRYTKSIDNSYFLIGKSGWVSIPTYANHAGWECFKQPGYVDLGLPSGILWATCNVGADNPEDFGEYYAWGETTTKTKYYKNYLYTGTPDVLPLQDDVANVKWGGKWRMPTAGEIYELISSCTISYTYINGIKCAKITSKINSASIFMPKTGHFDNGQVSSSDRYGIYWSSTSRDNDLAYGLYISDYVGLEGFYKHWYNKYNGFPIRPVRDK